MCVIPADKTLRLWIRAADNAKIDISPPPLDIAGDAVQGGHIHTFFIEDGVAAISVTVQDTQGTARWQLQLNDRASPDWHTQATDAIAARDVVTARALAAAHTKDEDDGGFAHDILANLAFLDGDTNAFQHHHRQAADAHRRAGMLSLATRNLTALAWSLMQEREFMPADAVLESLPTDRGGPAQSRYNAAYARGLLAFNTGNPREALRQLQTAAAQARRLGRRRQRMNADSLLAVQLQRLGRHEDAARLFDAWLSSPKDLAPCQEASLRTNLGWARLLSIEAGDAAPSPVPELARARAIFDGEDCGFAEGRAANNLINLALAHLHGGQLDDAAALLSLAAQESGLPARTVVWHTDIAARLAVARGQADEALRLYDSLQAADIESIAGGPWRVAVGRARALLAANDSEGALKHYAQAERLLDDVVNDVPISAGRASFLAQRRRATREHLGLLLDMGRATEAFVQARRARARVLRSVNCDNRLDRLDDDARQTWLTALSAFEDKRRRIEHLVSRRWTLPADLAQGLDEEVAALRTAARDDLDTAFAVCGQAPALPHGFPQLASGELLLAYHPVEDGWVGFALFDNTLHNSKLDCIEEAATVRAQSTCLIAPFSALLEQATRVRIQSLGHLNGIDFHALGDAQDKLLASRPVTYDLDITDDTTADVATIRRVLIVADAHGDLAAAREEARAVERELRAQGIEDITLLQGQAATMSRVKNALRNADLLHYAGHAVYSGHGGWDSVLQLADGTELGVADILALERLPHTVVLSGCETGRVSADDAPQSLGLAQAFLAAGAARVVAATRPVDDADALRIVTGLYANWQGGQALDEALHLAQARVREADDGADWAAYRLLTP